MYFALKPINLGEGRRVLAGEPVPQALTWPYVTLVAHLNLGYLKWESKDNEISPVDQVRENQTQYALKAQHEHAKPEFKKATKEQMTGIFGEEKMEQPEVRKNGEPIPKMEASEVKQAPSKPKQVLPKLEVKKETHTCTLCPGRTFTSPKNLKTHMTLAHDKRQ